MGRSLSFLLWTVVGFLLTSTHASVPSCLRSFDSASSSQTSWGECSSQGGGRRWQRILSEQTSVVCSCFAAVFECIGETIVAVIECVSTVLEWIVSGKSSLIRLRRVRACVLSWPFPIGRPRCLWSDRRLLRLPGLDLLLRREVSLPALRVRTSC